MKHDITAIVFVKCNIMTHTWFPFVPDNLLILRLFYFSQKTLTKVIFYNQVPSVFLQ